MSNKACKTKVCICAGIAEAQALETNLESALGAIDAIGATEQQLIDAGIDGVIGAADAAVEHLRKLNAVLVAFGVKLSS